MPPVVIIIHPQAIRNISQLTGAQEQFSIGQFISEPVVDRISTASDPYSVWKTAPTIPADWLADTRPDENAPPAHVQ